VETDSDREAEAREGGLDAKAREAGLDDEPASPQIRVLVADDDPLARQMITERLSGGDIVIVGQARNGDEAVEMALELRPDVVVMDLLMPGCDGITATRRIAMQAPEVQVVLLSVSSDEQVVLLGLRSGAVGFLDKRIEIEALARVVRGVHHGEAGLDRATTRALIAEFQAMSARSESKAADSHLSSREREVLTLLAEGLSTEEVAEELSLAVETVRTHVKAILRKLRVHSRQEAIVVARSRGIIVPSSDTLHGSIAAPVVRPSWSRDL
jgi:DNA-binding NarL/FixJ family response regulator